MKIYGVFNMSNSDNDIFLNDVTKAINKLQNDGQVVEIQYSTNVSECIKGGIVHSALIIGRK